MHPSGLHWPGRSPQPEWSADCNDVHLLFAVIHVLSAFQRRLLCLIDPPVMWQAKEAKHRTHSCPPTSHSTQLCVRWPLETIALARLEEWSVILGRFNGIARCFHWTTLDTDNRSNDFIYKRVTQAFIAICGGLADSPPDYVLSPMKCFIDHHRIDKPRESGSVSLLYQMNLCGVNHVPDVSRYELKLVSTHLQHIRALNEQTKPVS